VALLFDALAFLTEQFSSPQNILVMFNAYGMRPPNLAAVEKWFQRRSVPSEYLPMLICILELEKGGPVGLARYVKVTGANDDQ
jgi:hypothetical protein